MDKMSLEDSDNLRTSMRKTYYVSMFAKYNSNFSLLTEISNFPFSL